MHRLEWEAMLSGEHEHVFVQYSDGPLIIWHALATGLRRGAEMSLMDLRREKSRFSSHQRRSRVISVIAGDRTAKTSQIRSLSPVSTAVQKDAYAHDWKARRDEKAKEDVGESPK